MHWSAQAPANIALIKYMGKKDALSNLPDNASLSYTLNNLLSTVRLESVSTAKDYWQPLQAVDATNNVQLTAAGQKRFISHLQRIKDTFGYKGTFLIKSTNNFPHSSGLASSASSFAALTRCAVLALSELTDKALPPIEEQARLSRSGSGSSCRSFYAPWALWQAHQVTELCVPYKNLIHQVVLISTKEKSVSSSEAHQRVKSSPLYTRRSERAEQRLSALINALVSQQWSTIYTLCWDEFQDMHHLFHSCEQPFSYINQQSAQVLRQLTKVWDKIDDGPLITMDAGPNIHLLYRSDQGELAQQIKADYLDRHYNVL